MTTDHCNNAKPIHKQAHTMAIIQLARIGDVIQTMQSVCHFKTKYPQYKLILIARTQFAQPLEFILRKYFDEIYLLDASIVDGINDKNGLENSTRKLNQFLEVLKAENISVLINLTFSGTAALISSIINSKHRVGPYRDSQNITRINDHWSQLLSATVQRGSLNPFSLVDLFKKIIGIEDVEKLEDQKYETTLESISHSNKTTSNSKKIYIHPFASHDRKMWKPEKWVEVIYKILKDNDSVSITLVGSKEDSPRALTLISSPTLKPYLGRILNSVGKTSIESLYESLKNARIFIGHDSMVGHLSSLLNIPTLTISLGTVRPHETTPYHANAFCISPRTKCFPCFPNDACQMTQCHHDISYQLVVTFVNRMLKGEQVTSELIKENISSYHLNSVNIYTAKFNQKYYTLESLVENNPEINDIFRSIYSVVWSFIIEDQEIRIPFPKLSLNTHKILFECLDQVQRLFELNDFGKKYTQFILEEISSASPSLVKIKEYSKKVDEVDQLMNLIQNTCPFLAPVIEYYLLKKANLPGSNVVQLSENAYLTYEQCTQVCSIIYELIQNIIAEYKISHMRSHVSTKGKLGSNEA